MSVVKVDSNTIQKGETKPSHKAHQSYWESLSPWGLVVLFLGEINNPFGSLPSWMISLKRTSTHWMMCPQLWSSMRYSMTQHAAYPGKASSTPRATNNEGRDEPEQNTKRRSSSLCVVITSFLGEFSAPPESSSRRWSANRPCQSALRGLRKYPPEEGAKEKTSRLMQTNKMRNPSQLDELDVWLRIFDS